MNSLYFEKKDSEVTFPLPNARNIERASNHPPNPIKRYKDSVFTISILFLDATMIKLMYNIALEISLTTLSVNIFFTQTKCLEIYF